MKLKKSVKKKVNILIISLVVLILLVIGFLAYKRFFNNNTTPNKVKVVDKIGDYGYELEEDAPKEFKNLFEELRKLLSKDEFDEKEYASLVSRLLVLDFYNLDNKISKNDIGGVQFIRSDQQKNFILEASETVYKYIEHNVYGNRTQELPVVSKVEASEIKETTYKYKNINDEKAYKVTVDVTYKKDLGYPSKVTVVLIHNSDNEKKLEVIKMY